ncbi:MAG: carboxypeptidase-like regulatory domain-containing protein [Prevotella sp.]|nr:carboxypeptidase-like regulatory domain-containing protein [Prevotella sp.]MCD8289518.1 carboxypeptidase-like regulatory domain-containing protein [Prevotella sp.]
MRRTRTLQYLLLFPAVLILIPVRVMCQEAAHCITGIIVSDTENKPLEYVEVLVSDMSGNARANVLTDEGGAFSLRLASTATSRLHDGAEGGTYIFSYRLLGETLRADTVNINGDIDLGIISLPMINKDIDEVTVTGKRAVITFDKDKLVYNVKNSPYANGFSAFDVIKYVPGTDPTKPEEISLIGKDGVIVEFHSTF